MSNHPIPARTRAQETAILLTSACIPQPEAPNHKEILMFPCFPMIAGDPRGAPRGVALVVRITIEAVIQAAMLNGYVANGSISQFSRLSRETVTQLRGRYPQGHPLQNALKPHQDELDLLGIESRKFRQKLREVLADCFVGGWYCPVHGLTFKRAIWRAVDQAVLTLKSLDAGKLPSREGGLRISGVSDLNYFRKNGEAWPCPPEVKASKKEPAYLEAARSYNFNL